MSAAQKRAPDAHLCARPLTERLELLSEVAFGCRAAEDVSAYRRLLRESLPPEALRQCEPLWARLEELDGETMKVTWGIAKILARAAKQAAARQATMFDDEEMK